ncbi:MAG TPA: N-acetylneuraminate synthase family protein [Phycisphaerae bacterium]|nr:N-acetylneuraminate synthase family protein [Phycisphaerae bacterium]HRY71037.1 N-acetylneuraminate synthase family protein [Phycisphaerae bacterium]HSA29351.1 N-acetylneuraminate synthase family protein [Phycisphaerae bacterium]
MNTLTVIMARAGSKGLPDKCCLPLCSRPVIAYTIGHAQKSRRAGAIVLTTDSVRAQAIGRSMGIELVNRPPELAVDTARVDDVVRDAVEQYERRSGCGVDVVVILYGNIPVRADGIIDRCIDHLVQTGCDSVRTVAPVSKQHPDWLHRLNGDRMEQFRANSIHRRQDLEPVYYHDGAVIAVTRGSLFNPQTRSDPHGFFGRDRRAVVQRAEDSVDIDTAMDFYQAEAMIRARGEIGPEQAIEADMTTTSAPWSPICEASAGHLACPAFRIGDTLVGAPRSAFVIAEAGVNHDGDIQAARELVAAAAEAGADAVKFQVFAAHRLVTRTSPAADYQRRAGEGCAQYEMLERLELRHDEFEGLAELARRSGIQFLATPFSVPDLGLLVSLGVPALKLASTDIVNGPLLDAAAASGLPILASTGAADLHEVSAAVERLRRGEAGPLALLHCISSYPADPGEANLAAIGTLAREFNCVSGFSDHTESLTIGGLAVAAGAKVIEKHMTLDRRRSGPDHSFSLEPKAMAEYIRSVRDAARVLGDGQLEPTATQREVRRVSRASVVAARDIAVGEILARTMLTTKRPGDGISPMSIDSLVGRRVLRPIPADHFITWDILERSTVAV